jgi:hypothetical protein
LATGRQGHPREGAREAVKMVNRLQGATYQEKCRELGLESLEERRNSQDMALVHKFLTEKMGTDLFQRAAAELNTRTRQAAG